MAEHGALLAEMCTNLFKAHTRMKPQADKHHIDMQYQVGEWVFHKLQPYRIHSWPRRLIRSCILIIMAHFRLLTRSCQPYQWNVTSNPVFHVSFLKKDISPQVTPDSSTTTSLPTTYVDRRVGITGAAS